MALPFEAQNVLALDGSVPGSVTTGAGGVTQWDSQGASGNSFFNDHASTSNPGYSNPDVTFDGGDHLHRDPDAGPLGLIPATGDWAWVCRLAPNPIGDQIVFAQFIAVAGNGRVDCRIRSSNAVALALGDDATQPTVLLEGGTVTTGALNTFSARRSGNVYVIRLDGTQVDTHTDAGTRSILQTGNTIGSRASSTTDYDGPQSAFYDGSITRVGLWHGTFSDADLGAMEEWAEAGDFGGGGSTFSQRRKRFSP